jgi:hypothetical protein
MIKKVWFLLMLFIGITSIGFCQDTIPAQIERPIKKNYFEGYVYLISQDALATPEAFSVASSINLIGEFVLLGKNNEQRSTHFDYWLFTTEPSVPEESVPELAVKAGLLWNTNDLGSNVFMTGIGAMSIRQQFFEDKLSIRVGKIFPGIYYQTNYYSPNNSETHMNNMLSGNPVSTWFGSLGLGTMVEFEGNKWFAKLGIHDATAINEIDFKTLSDGKYFYVSELGIKSRHTEKENRFSILYSFVNQLPNKTEEHSISLGGVYFFGQDKNWGVYGRYSFRNGGVGKTEETKPDENVLVNGGFLGISNETPWKLIKAEIGGAFFYGQPTNYQINIGKKRQYGLETYFKWNFKELLHVALDFQLIDKGSALEPIIGLRFKAGWSTVF